MSSTRKMKRIMLKEWARKGKKPAEEIARAAKLEMQDVQAKAASFGMDVLGAMAMAIINDYGKMKTRSSRLVTPLEIVNQYYNAIQKGELTQEQKDIYHEFTTTFAEHWKDYDGKDEHNGKCMQSKK